MLYTYDPDKGLFQASFPFFLRALKHSFVLRSLFFQDFFMRFLQPCLKICQREESIMIQRTSMTTKGGVAFFNRMFTNVRAEALKKEEERELSLVNK